MKKSQDKSSQQEAVSEQIDIERIKEELMMEALEAKAKKQMEQQR